MPPLIDLTGKRFGRWTVLYRDTTAKYTSWICRCECGTVKSVLSHSLIRKEEKLRSTSCGCYSRECARKLMTKHGLRRTPVYNEWAGIKRRCYNVNEKAYKNYGGRGIKVCDEWRDSFQAFYDYVSGLPHFRESGRTLDRIDNEGDYEPGNVRWATWREQSLNRRTCKGYWDKPHKIGRSDVTK